MNELQLKLEGQRAALAAETNAAKKAALSAEIAATEAEIAASQAAPTSSKNIAPREMSVTGILLSVEEITMDTGDFVLIHIQDNEDEIHTIASSTSFWSKVGKFLKEDTTVKATFEVRKKGVTGYDNRGTWELHKSDGNNLSRITRYSEKSFDRSVSMRQRGEDLEILQVVESERLDAIARYLQGTFR